MENSAQTETSVATSSSGELKRKRSPSNDTHGHPAAPPPKAPKTHNHLQINYLARQNKDDLAIASTQDTMPEIIELLGHYHGVLERHESLACNLGARPLGPILIKRFERLFEDPPKVLKSHGKEGANITWLDVVEFARNKPEQFTLGQMSEGLKVCQFYTKQCRVQISEEDFYLINSGIPQKMIPPQPIVEDEEKELGTLEILEDKLSKICQLADQVAARTRQLNHRIKGRKQAILDRRATEPSTSVRPTSPSNVALMNGNAQAGAPAGFVAVNSRPQADANGTENSKSGASQSTREELLNRFQTLTDRKAGSSNGDPALQRGSISAPIQSGPPPVQQSGTDSELAALLLASNNTTSHAQPPYTTNAAVPMPHSPAAVVPGTSQYHHHGNSPTMPHAQQQSHPNATPRHSTAHEKEKPDDGPYKQEMVSRMEGLGKGERVLPPCDRCRRLHMDCLKNLTACMGCTKKHAKCSWREVREDELLGTAPAIRSGSTVGVGNQYHGLPMDPALQSPVYDQSYRPVMTTSAASMGSAPAYSYAHHASGGAEGGDHDSVEASLHQLAGFAEAEAAVTAAKRAQESREAIGDHHESITDPSRDQYEHIFRGGTNEEDRTRDADHAAYLEQLSNLHETHQSRVASHHENPQYPPMTDQQHEKSGDGSSNVRPRSRQDQNVEMTDMDKEHAELIQRRLARAQQDSPEGEASRNAAISPRTQDPALADRRSPYGYEDPQPRPGTAVSSGAGGSGAPEAAVREHIAAM